MARFADGGRFRRWTAQAACLAWACLGCTAANPAYDRSLAGPADAARQGEDAPVNEVSGPRPRDGASGPDSPGSRPSVDAVSVLVDSSARDAGPADVAPELGRAAVTSVGLVGYWPLDEGPGNSSILDHSGNANNGGTVVLDFNAAWVTGHASWALDIPDQYGASVIIAPTPSLDRLRTAFTLSAWVYREATIKDRNFTVLSRQYASTNREYYSLAFKNDTLAIWLYAVAPAAEVILYASQTAPLASWVHVAATWDGKTVRLYQGGVPVGSIAYAASLPTSTNPLILGNNVNTTGFDQPLGGRLDEVRIYDRALSASAIADLAR
jgi:hypothetical protein